MTQPSPQSVSVWHATAYDQDGVEIATATHFTSEVAAHGYADRTSRLAHVSVVIVDAGTPEIPSRPDTADAGSVRARPEAPVALLPAPQAAPQSTSQSVPQAA